MDTVISIRKPILQDFFRYIFPKTRGGKTMVSRTNEIGLLLCALWSYRPFPAQNDPEGVPIVLPRFFALDGATVILSASETPVEYPDAIAIRLPWSVGTLSASSHFIYYTEEATAKINDCLQSMFDLDYRQYVIQGREMGISRKDIANSYMIDRGLSSLRDDPEMLLKRHYRQELKRHRERMDYLVERGKYFAKKFNGPEFPEKGNIQ